MYNADVSYPMGIGALSSRLKWPEREAEHSPPPSAEVKNEWNCTCPSRPPYFFMALCLINHRDKFTFVPLFFTLYCRE
jgi:hypothetical protein